MTFDQLRSQTEPCVTCGRLVQGSDRQPRYLSPPVASVAQAWRIYYPKRTLPHGQPDSHEGGAD